MTDQTHTHTTDDGSETTDDLDDLEPGDYQAAAEHLAQDAPDAEDDTPEPEDGSPRDQRYRARAQAAEAERDYLGTVVDGMRRAEVQRLAAPRLADPADVFRDGAELADVLDAEGRVDPGKLDTLIDGLVDTHPHWRAPIAPYSGPLYSGATNMRSVDRPSPGFADAFTPRSD